MTAETELLPARSVGRRQALAGAGAGGQAAGAGRRWQALAGGRRWQALAGAGGRWRALARPKLADAKFLFY